MAEDQFQASGNWWETARNVRFESEANSQTSSSSGITNMGNLAWQQARSSMDSLSSVSGGFTVAFHDTQHKLQPQDSSSTSTTDPNLHTMGLSSQPMDWNQTSLLRGEKGTENSSFRAMLQENLSSPRSNFQQESEMGLSQWRSENMLFSDSSSSNEFNKQVISGFSLLNHQNQFSPQDERMDSSSALYGNSSSIILQGANNSFENRPLSSFPSYGLNTNELVPNSNWSKVPQFLRASSPKQQANDNNQLHFTNNASFWTASEVSPIKDVPSSFFIPSLQQPPFSTPNFDLQSKKMGEVRESSGGVGKKSESEGGEPKRPRNETPSPLPAFKVRKQKMGDRITALQQLVSPFGKTDTASVLSEAIEYIKLLHEQVAALSTPYMKSGTPTQIQQSCGKSKEGEGPKQDLRSRGLCLVPVSSTFPVTHESIVDLWTPTFGGISR